MKVQIKTIVGLACSVAVSGVLAVSSSVKVNVIDYKLTDLDPLDGIAPEVVFDPTFDFYNDQQPLDVTGMGGFDFLDMRCGTCPVLLGDAEISANDMFELAGRTLGPSSLYLDQSLPISPYFGLTRASALTVSLDVTFNESLVGPIGLATLDLRVVGYTLLPDSVERNADGASFVSTIADDHATIEASFTNNGDRLTPFHIAYAMLVRGDTPPIPEPRAWALMVAGLGLFGRAVAPPRHATLSTRRY